MVRRLSFVYLIVLFLIFISACGVKLAKLTTADISSTPSKKIYIRPFWGYSRMTQEDIDSLRQVGFTDMDIQVIKQYPQITAKLEDYFKKAGWEVLAYHKALNKTDWFDDAVIALGYKPELVRQQMKQYLKESMKHPFSKTPMPTELSQVLEKIKLHPKNWNDQALLNADYLLLYDIHRDFTNKNKVERYLEVHLFKLTNTEEKKQVLLKNPNCIYCLAEKKVSFKVEALYPDNKKASDYIATQIIMLLKDKGYLM